MEVSCPEEEIGITIVLLEASYDSTDIQRLRGFERDLAADLQDSSVGLLMDFGEASFFGGGFLSSLLCCYGQALLMSRRFAMCSLKPWPRQVLRVTRLDSVWDLFETRQEAIAAMQVSLDQGSGISIVYRRLAPVDPLSAPFSQRFDQRSRWNAFRVWVTSDGETNSVRVEGFENGKRLLACLTGSAIVERRILGKEDPCGFYTFLVANTDEKTHSMLMKALAEFPEIILMRKPI